MVFVNLSSLSKVYSMGNKKSTLPVAEQEDSLAVQSKAVYEDVLAKVELIPEGFIRKIGESLDGTVIPQSVIKLCYQFYICPNILFEMVRMSPPLKYGMGLRVMLQHSHGSNLGTSQNNPVSVKARHVGQFNCFWIVRDNHVEIIELSSRNQQWFIHMYDRHNIDIGRGNAAKFKIIRYPQISEDIISLESESYPGYFIAVNDKLSVYSHDINQPIHNYNENHIYHRSPGYLKCKRLVALRLADINGICQYVGIAASSPTRIHLKSNIDDYTTWNMHVYQNDFVKFENVVSHRYLRMDNRKQVNVNGTGGMFTIFNHNVQQMTLESYRYSNHYLCTRDMNLHWVRRDKQKEKDENKATKFHIEHLENQEKQKVTHHNDSIVYIRSTTFAQGGYIGINEYNQVQVVICKERTEYCEWHREEFKDGLLFKFRNVQSGRYLRIRDRGDCVDAGGGGGMLTPFKYHDEGLLVSNKFKTRCLATTGLGPAREIVSGRIGTNTRDSLFEIIDKKSTNIE